MGDASIASRPNSSAVKNRDADKKRAALWKKQAKSFKLKDVGKKVDGVRFCAQDERFFREQTEVLPLLMGFLSRTKIPELVLETLTVMHTLLAPPTVTETTDPDLEVIHPEVNAGFMLERSMSADSVWKAAYIQLSSVLCLDDDMQKWVEANAQVRADILRYLIREWKIDLSTTASGGLTALHLAVKSDVNGNNLPVIDVLLSCSALNVNAVHEHILIDSLPIIPSGAQAIYLAGDDRKQAFVSSRSLDGKYHIILTEADMQEKVKLQQQERKHLTTQLAMEKSLERDLSTQLQQLEGELTQLHLRHAYNRAEIEGERRAVQSLEQDYASLIDQELELKRDCEVLELQLGTQQAQLREIRSQQLYLDFVSSAPLKRHMEEKKWQEQHAAVALQVQNAEVENRQLEDEIRKLEEETSNMEAQYARDVQTKQQLEASLRDIQANYEQFTDAFERTRTCYTPRPNWDSIVDETPELSVQKYQWGMAESSSTGDEAKSMINDTDKDKAGVLERLDSTYNIANKDDDQHADSGRTKTLLKRRVLKKIDVEKVVRKVWVEKRKREQRNPLGRFSLEQVLYEKLHRKYGFQPMIAEWGYNLLLALQLFSWDSEIEMFLLCLTGAVSDLVYVDQEQMIQGCQQLLLRLCELYNVESFVAERRVLLKDALVALRTYFPLKTSAQLQAIEQSIIRDMHKMKRGGNDSILYIDDILPLDVKYPLGFFVKTIRTQHFKEIHDYYALLLR
ncbi:hypothetical protein JG688_00011956 [Phytophthora aleatoria]|uniref:Uncharacterized protein n=1 Tax=Phytophthora aleatoria TaxID=2496075 RepID=A0A8J5IG17_9STRA|nr:hypothetical protein JG688_00011956 [Phytophthora aleatoria]